MDDEPFDAPDPVTSSDSEGDGAVHRGSMFPKKLPQPLNTPKRTSQRHQQLQTPPQTQPKAPRGPIPTLAPGQVLSQKVPKVPKMPR
jgi:hypothetical protein